MKKAVIITLCSFSLLLASCKKEYEKVPVEQLTIDYVFNKTDSNGVTAKRFLNSIYAVLPKGLNRVGDDLLDAASDDAMSSANGVVDVVKLSTAAYSASNFPGAENYWGLSYGAIRRANIFISNINVVPFREKLPNGLSIGFALKGEARFLRALFYFELVRRYGGVPLMGDRVPELNDDIELPRNTFSECIEYIVDECDAIKDSLRTNPIIDPLNYSHVATRGAALALKARALLYAASPLYNGTASQNALLGYPAYDAARWQRAATAAKDIMDLNVFNLVPQFKDVFLSATNSEIIFLRENAASSHGIEDKNAPVGYTTAGGAGRTSPTQELVDAFPMINGKSITDPASGYNPTNPYENRDSRFDKTILYNGHAWLNTSLETFIGGKSRPGGTQQQTLTGYYMRKFMGDAETANSFPNNNQDFLVFRFAEVLLNFAEAQNEATGPNTDVFDALIRLRQRAGIEAGGDNSYGLNTGATKEELREVIRNERRIELAFEEHRYFDVRRWKIAEDVLNRTLHGMAIQRYANGTLEYQVTPALTIVFNAARQYYYPIPYDEVVKNRNMQQNPGWGL